MIIIAGTVPIDPARKADALAAMQAMQAATQAETGCIHYHFYTNPWDDAEIHIFEVWQDEDCLQAHFRSAHMDTFNQQIPSYVTGPMRLKRYEVSSVSDL